MTALSILDLIMIGEEKSLVHSLDEALQFARRAEAAGYSRYWVAEHHNMPGIGSSATTIIMSHLAGGTSSIRIGSGGIMLPNHAPLIVAEQFATLETLYPGRIDLGVGRAPGSDRETVLAIRGQNPAPREFSDDVTAVMNYLQDNRRQPARGIPGIHDIPVWILGSGLYGARLAAELGLPFAFASHFAPPIPHASHHHLSRTFSPFASARRTLCYGWRLCVRSRKPRGSRICRLLASTMGCKSSCRPAGITPQTSRGIHGTTLRVATHRA